MRKSKEERIIEHGNEILKELHRVYLEGIGIEEYYKLLSEYKKLYRRYDKTIKLSDNMGNAIMVEKDSLSDNLQYTIKTARNKLLENVSEHRKTKDASEIYKEKIKQYEIALDESQNENIKLRKKLNSYIKHFGEIKHQFSEDLSYSNDNNEQKTTSIKEALSLEISKEKSEFVLLKIRLKDFARMREVIEQNGSISNFFKGVHKFIENSFNKDCIVLNDKVETFYILCRNTNLDEVKILANKLNKKRRVYNFDISFYIGITNYIDKKDTVDTLLKRCDRALENSIQCSDIVVN